jgi:NAD(P)H-dependent FMN reductase
VGFVSYGGVAAGTRAVQQLKQVVGALQLIPTGTAVNIPFVFAMIDDGALDANDVMAQAASAMLGELETLHGTLVPLRSRG